MQWRIQFVIKIAFIVCNMVIILLMYRPRSLYHLFQGNVYCLISRLKSVTLRLGTEHANKCKPLEPTAILEFNVQVIWEVDAWRLRLWKEVASLCVKWQYMAPTVSMYYFHSTWTVTIRWMTGWLNQPRALCVLWLITPVYAYPWHMCPHVELDGLSSCDIILSDFSLHIGAGVFYALFSPLRE